jgi:hypothetical protein
LNWKSNLFLLYHKEKTNKQILCSKRKCPNLWLIFFFPNFALDAKKRVFGYVRNVFPKLIFLKDFHVLFAKKYFPTEKFAKTAEKKQN